MSKIIAIANQKGGVGKTTTSINLAASLAYRNHRVLLIDMDPQGNATMGCGVDKQSLKATANDVLLGRSDIQSAIQKCNAEFDLLPGNADLTEASVNLLNDERRESALKSAIEPIRFNYEYIFIDCPPSLDMLTLNALVAADSVIITMQCEYYALEGMAGLLNTIEQIRTTLNSQLHVEGVLRTMYDGRNRLAGEVATQLREHFGDRLFHTLIPRNIRLAEAPSYGLPALQYEKTSLGAQAYLQLADEFIARNKRRIEHTQGEETNDTALTEV